MKKETFWEICKSSAFLSTKLSHDSIFTINSTSHMTNKKKKEVNWFPVLVS